MFEAILTDLETEEKTVLELIPDEKGDNST